MCEVGRTIQVAREVKNYKIGVLGVRQDDYRQDS
jgi:hypothetical protein